MSVGMFDCIYSVWLRLSGECIAFPAIVRIKGIEKSVKVKVFAERILSGC